MQKMVTVLVVVVVFAVVAEILGAAGGELLLSMHYIKVSVIYCNRVQSDHRQNSFTNEMEAELVRNTTVEGKQS